MNSFSQIGGEKLLNGQEGGDAITIIFCGFDLGRVHCYVEEKRYENIIFNFLNLFLYALNHKTSAYNYNKLSYNVYCSCSYKTDSCQLIYN